MREDIELAFPYYGEQAAKLELWVDASDLGAGACLKQQQDGIERVIAYNSIAFNRAQRRYSTVDKELAALRWAVKAFKSFLFGVNFVVKTDHQPLVYLHVMRLVDNRLARTLADLSEFSFSIEFVPGKDNTAADALSRLIRPLTDSESPDPFELPPGLQLDGEPSPGGGDSLVFSLYRWLKSQGKDVDISSSRRLREILIDELLRNPGRYGIKEATKAWRRDMKLRRLPDQLMPMEVLLVFSFMYSVSVEVYFWAGSPIIFRDIRIEGEEKLSLQCLGGIHFNLLSGGQTDPPKSIYYLAPGRGQVSNDICTEIHPSQVDEMCSCPVSTHPRVCWVLPNVWHP